MSVISPLVGALDSALEAMRQPGEKDVDRLAGAITDARDLAVEVTRELDRLMVRYIAQLRLYEDLHIDRVCDAIEDIVVNILGSEDFVVYLRDNDGHMYPVRGMGPSDDNAGGLDADHALTRISMEDRPRFGEDGFVALAPLVDAQGTPRGLIVLKGLLRHKPSFTDEDRAVLEELRVHAGRAIGWTISRQGTSS